MWEVTQTVESQGRVIKFMFQELGEFISFSRFIELLRSSFEFRAFFRTELSGVPFAAFRWETPAVCSSNLAQSFECVVLDSPGLDRAPDVNAFSDVFKKGSDEAVFVFPNLGRDAINHDRSRTARCADFVRALRFVFAKRARCSSRRVLARDW
jgi:hypothetical protein